MIKNKLVVFSGAGISAESGLKTFRDSNGLWENYKVEDVATPEAWKRNPHRVLSFYNQRRKQVIEAKPNAAHYALVELEKKFDVQIITQNIDDLHERAGSKKVLHLHGEITKSRSSLHPDLVYKVPETEINIGDTCEKGSQLRPHVVWFGESVPQMESACRIVEKAAVFIIVGTSLSVYPAASLIEFVPRDAPKYLIDPQPLNRSSIPNLVIKRENAVIGITEVVNNLLK